VKFLLTYQIGYFVWDPCNSEFHNIVSRFQMEFFCNQFVCMRNSVAIYKIPVQNSNLISLFANRDIGYFAHIYPVDKHIMFQKLYLDCSSPTEKNVLFKHGKFITLTNPFVDIYAFLRLYLDHFTHFIESIKNSGMSEWMCTCICIHAK